MKIWETERIFYKKKNKANKTNKQKTELSIALIQERMYTTFLTNMLKKIGFSYF